MSDAFWQYLPATIIALLTLPGTIASVVVMLRVARKADAIKADTVVLPEIKKATDGMTTQMVASARVEGAAEGKAEEQANPTSVSAALSNAVDRRKPQQ